MITHRQIALCIVRGRRFHKALQSAIDAGPVTKEQFDSIAKAHKIDKSIVEGYIVAGLLCVYELSKDASAPKQVMLLESDKSYLAYWKDEPDEEMAFSAVIATEYFSKIEAFVRFMRYCNLPHSSNTSCNLPSTRNCLHCNTPFAFRSNKKYCSDKCRWDARDNRKATPPKQLPQETRVMRALKSFADFLQSL